MTDTIERNRVLSEVDIPLRVKAIETLLIEKGLATVEDLDAIVDRYENDLSPMNGAKVVARAWVDPEYKKRLLEDGTAAILELGYGGIEGEHMVVVENTPEVHNIFVCTLCGCYPWPVLGLPPNWFKSLAYRSRIVIEPRKVLKEDFDLEIPPSVELRIWDSLALTRYLVLPERPAGTEQMSEAELTAIVTRDSMIGVSKISSPS